MIQIIEEIRGPLQESLRQQRPEPRRRPGSEPRMVEEDDQNRNEEQKRNVIPRLMISKKVQVESRYIKPLVFNGGFQTELKMADMRNRDE